MNEPARVAELGRIGVGSVSTDNLAILSGEGPVTGARMGPGRPWPSWRTARRMAVLAAAMVVMTWVVAANFVLVERSACRVGLVSAASAG